MSFSRSAATGFVPLLSRLVLAAAFIPAGWAKWQGEDKTYEGDAARILRDLNIGQDITPESDVDTESDSTAMRIIPAMQGGTSLRDRKLSEAPDEAAGGIGEATESVPLAFAEEDHAADDTDVSLPNSAPAEPVKASPVHGITVMLVDIAGWDPAWPVKPQHMAYMAMVTELVGGVLILLGFMSRIWGLGLAITMAFAFYMTTYQHLDDVPNLLMITSTHTALFNTAFSQIGLFVLGFGIMLTGAGPLSIDRFLFGRKSEVVEVDTDD